MVWPPFFCFRTRPIGVVQETCNQCRSFNYGRSGSDDFELLANLRRVKVHSSGGLEKTVGDPPYANKAMALTGLFADPCLGFAEWGRIQHWPYPVESDLTISKWWCTIELTWSRLQPSRVSNAKSDRSLPPAKDLEAFFRWPFATCSHISHERMTAWDYPTKDARRAQPIGQPW